MDYRTKNILAVVVFLLLLWISFQFAIKKTIIEKERYQVLVEQEELNKSLPLKLSKLKKETLFIEQQFKSFGVEYTSIQNDLIHVITNEAKTKSLKLLAFNDPHVFVSDKNIAERTYVIDLEGEFVNILKFIYQLEQNYSFGEIIHINFNKERDFKTKKNKLLVSIMIRSLD